MFIEKYLNNTKLNLLYDVYELEYINNLDEENFSKVYEVFRQYKFYFIDDIILNYLEIFKLNPSIVERKILELIKELGSKYNYIIGDNLTLLEKILN